MNKFFLWIIILLILGCEKTEKYEMLNMVGNDDYIDITNYVKKKYKPIYNRNKEICALIKPNPRIIDVKIESDLRTSLMKYFKETDFDYDIDKLDLYKNSKYQYSYIITDKLIDVYKININEHKFFFRLDEEKNIILPIKEEGWVIW